MPSETTANGVDRIVHTLDLNELGFDDIPIEARTQVKQDIADFLEEEILRDVSNGTSPVQGEGRFKRLDKDYAQKKGGGRLSNLELEGDLLTDFFVKKTRGSKLKIGHEGAETPKADGHNQLSSKAREWARRENFPRRRYIPDDGQSFKRRIVDGMKRIIDQNVPDQAATESESEEVEVETGIDEVVTGQTDNILDTQQVGVNELFSDESIDNFFAAALERLNRG